MANLQFALLERGLQSCNKLGDLVKFILQRKELELTQLNLSQFSTVDTSI